MSVRSPCEANDLAMRQVSVHALEANRGHHASAGAVSHVGYRNDEQSLGAHLNAATHGDDQNEELPVGCSAEKFRVVRVGLYAHVRQNAIDP